MKLKSTAIAFMIGALSLFGAGVSYAGEHQKHAAEALTHAQAAADEGKKGGTAQTVAGHIQEALNHAGMAGKVKEDTHITQAETALNTALAYCKEGDVEKATESAGEGVDHLKMAYKETEGTKGTQ